MHSPALDNGSMRKINRWLLLIIVSLAAYILMSFCETVLISQLKPARRYIATGLGMIAVVAVILPLFLYVEKWLSQFAQFLARKTVVAFGLYGVFTILSFVLIGMYFLYMKKWFGRWW